eukprot:gene37064-45722_t
MDYDCDVDKDSSTLKKDIVHFVCVLTIFALCRTLVFIVGLSEDGKHNVFAKKLNIIATLSFCTLICIEDKRFGWAQHSVAGADGDHAQLPRELEPTADSAQYQVLFLKGAPDVLLTKCNRYLTADGDFAPVDEAFRAIYTTAYEEFGGEGERVLGFAMRPMERTLAEEEALDKDYKDKLKEDLVGTTVFYMCIKRFASATAGMKVVVTRIRTCVDQPLPRPNYIKTTTNAIKSIARGGALQCAMLSTSIAVKPFNIVDGLPHGIVTHSAAFDDHELTVKNKTSDFAITLAYDDAAVTHLPKGENCLKRKFTTKIPAAIAAAAPVNDVHVTWNLDKNGFVYVQSALEEIKEAEAPKKRFKTTDLLVHAEHHGLTSDEKAYLFSSLVEKDNLRSPIQTA